MTKIDNGGPAFPAEGGTDSGLHPNPGMSLRDWFAGQALVGMMRSMVPWSNEFERCAAAAYDAADAMLAARQAGDA